MRLLSDFSEISEPESNYGLSCISVYKGQSSKTLNVGLSQSRSFYERGSETLQSEEDTGKDKGNGLENGPKDYLLSDSENSLDKDLVCDFEKVLDGPGVSLLGENTVLSGQSLHPRQLDNFLNVNSNKFEKIHKGLLPGPLHGT